MANILIAGCGYVGTALGLRLVKRGHKVFALRGDVRGLPKSFNRMWGRITGRITFNLDYGFDYVVCTIGASEYTEAAYRTAYVDAVKGLLDALVFGVLQGPRNRLERHPPLHPPPKRILFTSSTAVYAQNDGAWVDEDSPTEPAHFSGRLLLEGERIVRDSGIGVVLRLGGIYGPGRTRLIKSVHYGEARLESGPARYLNLNHRDDCAGALEHLLFLDNPDPVYLGCDGHPEDRNTIIRWLAERLNVECPPIATKDEPPLQRQATNKRCSNKRLVESGYAFQYPSYKEGYASLLSNEPPSAPL